MRIGMFLFLLLSFCMPLCPHASSAMCTVIERVGARRRAVHSAQGLRDALRCGAPERAVPGGRGHADRRERPRNEDRRARTRCRDFHDAHTLPTRPLPGHSHPTSQILPTCSSSLTRRPHRYLPEWIKRYSENMYLDGKNSLAFWLFFGFWKGWNTGTFQIRNKEIYCRKVLLAYKGLYFKSTIRDF